MKRPLLIAVMVLVPSLASAHSTAQWIADGAYRSALGSTCCGVSDCHNAGQAAFRRVEGGWSFDVEVGGKKRTLFAPDASVHPSKDNDVWFCAMPQDYLEDRARCLFLPQTS